MKMKFFASIIVLASLTFSLRPSKAQMETDLTPEQIKIARSRAYSSSEDARQFDLLLANKNRTPDEEATLQTLIDAGLRVYNEGNELAENPFRTPEETQKLARIKAALTRNALATARIISLIYSAEAFDLATKSLPENYEGVSFDVLWISLQSKFEDKQEFETSAAYAERMKTAITSPIFGQSKIDSIFASRLSADLTSTQYNADKQTMQVQFSLFSSSDVDKTKSLKVSETTKPLGSYTGSNAYGAKAEILKSQEQHRFLVHDNNKDFKFKFDTSYPKISVNIPMPTEVAIEAKPNIRVLSVYRVKKPYTGFQTRHISPTVTYPADKQIENRYVIVDLLALWFYNAETGVIYLKLEPQKR